MINVWTYVPDFYKFGFWIKLLLIGICNGRHCIFNNRQQFINYVSTLATVYFQQFQRFSDYCSSLVYYLLGKPLGLTQQGKIRYI